MSTRGKPLFEASPKGCRYPVGYAGQHLFCDDPRATGSSFCPEHHAVCWVKATTRLPSRRALPSPTR